MVSQSFLMEIKDVFVGKVSESSNANDNFSTTVPPNACASDQDLYIPGYPASCNDFNCRNHQTWADAKAKCDSLGNECNGITKTNAIEYSWEVRSGTTYKYHPNAEASYLKSCYNSIPAATTTKSYGFVPDSNMDQVTFDKTQAVTYDECVLPSSIVEQPLKHQMDTTGDETIRYWEENLITKSACMTFSVKADSSANVVFASQKYNEREVWNSAAIPNEQLTLIHRQTYWVCSGAYTNFNVNPAPLISAFMMGYGDVAGQGGQYLNQGHSGDPDTYKKFSSAGFQSSNGQVAHWADYKSIGAPNGYPCYSHDQCQNYCESGTCVHKSCTQTSDCNSYDHFCDTSKNQCLPKLSDGESCTKQEQCREGNCSNTFWTSLGLDDEKVYVSVPVLVVDVNTNTKQEKQRRRSRN